MKFATILKISIPLVVLIVVSIFFVEAVKPTAVVVQVKRNDAVRSVTGTVKVLTKQSMQLRSAESGRVIESKLEVGGIVREGELLAQLDTVDVEIELEKAKIDLDAAKQMMAIGSPSKGSLEAAKESLADIERMLELGSASPSQVAERRRNVQAIEDNIRREQVNRDQQISGLENYIRTLERRREKMRIVSPISGVVSEVYAFEGDLLGAGNAIALVISDERIVEVSISEENFTGIEEGQSVIAKFLGYGNREFFGIVSKVLPVADPNTQRYAVHVDLEIEDDLLFPGLTGESSITIDKRENALVLPTAALRGSYAFVVEEGVVRVVEVQKGYQNMVSVEILSGLEEGTQVIVEDLDSFREGDHVKVIEKAL